MAKFKDKGPKKGPSQRQLQVGEELRHALSQMFSRGEMADPRLNEASITVSEVRISPDLKNATAYILPLAGKNKEQIKDALNDETGNVRYQLGKKVRLRHIPRISFRLDDTFENASRINDLLNQPHVAQDVQQNDSN